MLMRGILHHTHAYCEKIPSLLLAEWVRHMEFSIAATEIIRLDIAIELIWRLNPIPLRC